MPDGSCLTARVPLSLEAPVRISTVSNLETLEHHRDEWSDLAIRAIESNVFYEPEMLLPALRYVVSTSEWRVLLIHQGDRLVALVPLQRRAIGRVRTSLVLQLLGYRHSFLHVPLIDATAARVAVDAWLSWCARVTGPALLLCHRLTLDGPVCDFLRDRANRRGMALRETHQFQRPALTLDGEAESYLNRALGRDRRRHLRKQMRLLEAEGQVAFRWIQSAEDPEPWIDSFLALESKGWKGRSGTAIASNVEHISFFRSMITALHASGRAMLGGLTLDGRWIAMSCGLRAASPDRGLFGFKTAYDEELSGFAPGRQLEVEYIRHAFSRRADIRWLDSYCGPDTTVIARLWADRRRIGNVAVGAPGLKGAVAIWALRQGLARRLSRRIVSQKLSANAG